MNDWSRRRKRIILAIFLFAVIVVIGIPVFFLFYQKPTCFDSKLNSDETGVDCGGSCQLLCSAESLPLIVKGDPRILTVATSTYEVIALVENPNSQGEISRAGYTFKLYSLESPIPIKIIEGETFIPKGATFAIFEGPFTLEENVVPLRATLEWKTSSLNWKKNTAVEPELATKDPVVSRVSTTPRLEAVVENLSLESVSNIDVVALISDESGNVFAASKTLIDSLPPSSEAPIIFTWPRPFKAQAANIEIFTRIMPDRSFIR